MNLSVLQYGLLALALCAVTVLTIFDKMDAGTATTLVVAIAMYSTGHSIGINTVNAITSAQQEQKS